MWGWGEHRINGVLGLGEKLEGPRHRRATKALDVGPESPHPIDLRELMTLLVTPAWCRGEAGMFEIQIQHSLTFSFKPSLVSFKAVGLVIRQQID